MRRSIDSSKKPKLPMVMMLLNEKDGGVKHRMPRRGFMLSRTPFIVNTQHSAVVRHFGFVPLTQTRLVVSFTALHFTVRPSKFALTWIPEWDLLQNIEKI